MTKLHFELLIHETVEQFKADFTASRVPAAAFTALCHSIMMIDDPYIALVYWQGLRLTATDAWLLAKNSKRSDTAKCLQMSEQLRVIRSDNEMPSN
ncbi:hypothetical protein M514_10172 [Trichuris suis]|uniref:Uncharacterized protein n=1 Tax=Trichuris suis TaxID=68888 RepID=A0A085LVD5_9BILA|nr:hypothetical protein M513_10172 [Trichuris suis]KFD68475.1 hypothetical protein M514_10172 [Trichuris suis]